MCGTLGRGAPQARAQTRHRDPVTSPRPARLPARPRGRRGLRRRPRQPRVGADSERRVAAPPPAPAGARGSRAGVPHPGRPAQRRARPRRFLSPRAQAACVAARARIVDRARRGRAAQGSRLRGGGPELVGGGAAVAGSGAFCVRHRPLGPPAAMVVVVGAVAVASGSVLAWNASALEVHGELEWLPLAVGAAGVSGVLLLTHLLFRPLGAPRELPGSSARRAAVDLVRCNGHDTLAFFKLRQDAHYHFNRDHSAFLGYRVAKRRHAGGGRPGRCRRRAPGSRERRARSRRPAGCVWRRSARARTWWRPIGRPASGRSTSGTRRSSTPVRSRSRAVRSGRYGNRCLGRRRPGTEPT